MFSSYVFKVRRDFSCVLIPGRCFTPSSKRPKRNALRAYDDFGSATAAYAAGCDCSGCIADTKDVRVNKSNASVNGYVIGSRSKQAIKNAANSIFFRSEHKELLRFVTFTFPPVPRAFESKVEEDKYLHTIFKKFLDNERKNYGLNKWLWTNERQSGERLEKHEKSAREVLHYHCIFEYKDRINYYLVNLRFLRLLHRSGFDILSSYSKSVKKSSMQYSHLKNTCQAIAKGDYNYLIQDTERMYLRDNLGIKRFIFLSPVDFEKIRYSALDIGQIAAYISKYVSKASDKVYCRRWGSSQGLVLSTEQLDAFMKDLCAVDLVNEDTGEIMQVIDKQRLFNFMIMGDSSTQLLRCKMDINGREEDFYYIPSNWKKWRRHSLIVQKFKEYFGYEI